VDMIQVLPEPEKRPSFGRSFRRELENIPQLAREFQQSAQEERKNLQKLYAEYGLKSKLEQEKQTAKTAEKLKLLGMLPGFGKRLTGEQSRETAEFGDMEAPEMDQTEMGMAETFDPSQITDQDILAATIIDPNVGRALANIKESVQEKEKQERKLFEGERKYHTEFTKDLEKDLDQRKEALSKKRMSLDFARDAIESGNESFFSLDKLADITGLDLFRTAKGAQLITAGKESLLSNMSRASARAQNLWFEQRLNSMFPKIGQSKEANLTVQEMLEAEANMEDAYIKKLEQFSNEDVDKYGFEKKDVKRRARDAIRSQEKEIFNRASYRMKQIEEQEKGISQLKKEIGKKVPKGTPLTLAMAKLYAEKFGKDALNVAEKAGYQVPSLEEYRIFAQTPKEFREAS